MYLPPGINSSIADIWPLAFARVNTPALFSNVASLIRAPARRGRSEG